MENKSHALAAGSFVLVLMALLVALTLWLTRDRHDYDLYELSTSDAISGLQTQATVRYKGVAVGKVTDITFDESKHGNVLIRIAVDRRAPVTPTGTFAMLGYQGVTGMAHVHLDDSPEPTPESAAGPTGIPRLPMKSSPLSMLADQGMTIVAKVDEATQRINKLLGDTNQERFTELLGNMNSAAGQISELTRTMHQTLQKQVTPAMQELPLMAQDARKAMQALEQAGQSASALMQDMQQIANKVQAPDGTLQQIQLGTQSMARAIERFDRGTLPGFDQAASDVSSAARQLGAAVSGISDNPQSLIYGPGAARPGPGEPGFVMPTAPALRK